MSRVTTQASTKMNVNPITVPFGAFRSNAIEARRPGGTDMKLNGIRDTDIINSVCLAMFLTGMIVAFA